jgi:hypothetical protein
VLIKERDHRLMNGLHSARLKLLVKQVLALLPAFTDELTDQGAFVLPGFGQQVVEAELNGLLPLLRPEPAPCLGRVGQRWTA